MHTREQVTEKLGGYNNMPPNWHEITESEFYWRYGHEANRFHDYRQCKVMTVNGFGAPRTDKYTREVYLSVYMFVNHDFSGIGFIKHYNGQATRSEIDAYWPQYFAWTWCEHEFETIASHMCYWEGRCKKCGYVRAIDSSD
jgi:hypothetical protein